MENKFFLPICFLILSLGLAAEGNGRELFFSGYEWIVKEYSRPIGPGPNRFSENTVQRKGEKLELHIISRWFTWYCAEIYSKELFSCGTFTVNFYLSEPLDSNSVFGFFLYNDRIPPHYNELDFEIARWGSADNPPYSFTVQPYDAPGNIHPFRARETGYFTCRIIWKPNSADFALFDGEGRPLESWTYRGSHLPSSNESRVHMNLWLFQGNSPGGDGSLQIEILSFEFEPFH